MSQVDRSSREVAYIPLKQSLTKKRGGVSYWMMLCLSCFMSYLRTDTVNKQRNVWKNEILLSHSSTSFESLDPKLSWIPVTLKCFLSFVLSFICCWWVKPSLGCTSSALFQMLWMRGRWVGLIQTGGNDLSGHHWVQTGNETVPQHRMSFDIHFPAETEKTLTWVTQEQLVSVFDSCDTTWVCFLQRQWRHVSV